MFDRHATAPCPDPHRSAPLPSLRTLADPSRQTIGDGEPHFSLGGENHNFQFSSAKYMKDVWPRLKAAKLKTASVLWEHVEPVEHQFSFSEVDDMIQDARRHDSRLVLLWYGSFKNTLSTYAPAWVKQNPARFPRAEICTPQGERSRVDALSVFGEHAQLADARAFAALMKHLKEVDGDAQTVLMVQVESEVGLLGDSRDRSPVAEASWRQPIPAELFQTLKLQWSHLNSTFQRRWSHLRMISPLEMMSWADIASGDKRPLDELFMAYHFALYVEKVAAAGKVAYDLPMYTSVWQNSAGQDRAANIPNVSSAGGRPGDSPSGGGVVNVLDIWKIFAPSLDLISFRDL